METCGHKNADYRSIHGDSCCSCHISPPCSYCTDQELYCRDCDEVIEEYTVPGITSSPIIISLTKYKTAQERFNELPDNVFGCVKYPNDGWGMAIKGKLPKEGMTRAEILAGCGICEYGCPSFKYNDGKSFHLTYTYD